MSTPLRLRAPDPQWRRSADVVVVGSGVAGLTVARKLAAAERRVVLIAKSALRDSNTCWAQGGIAIACAAGDSVESHLADTLTAGAGLADPAAVRTLVTEGPRLVLDLVNGGAGFDRVDGRLTFTREGGHSRPRILHAGGDATGREIQRCLQSRLAGVETMEHTFALDLVTEAAAGTGNRADRRTTGITVASLDRAGRPESVGLITANAVVLATGGLGQLFAVSSNPDVATGDGVAMALRAGAVATDLEFVQFHPTVFYAGSGSRGRQLLISEAVRGEGAVLVDASGERIMTGVHPLADLAPRDVVSLAISRRMAEADTDHVFLDARGIGAERFAARFPTIHAGCVAAGVDPGREPIPVAPAAHYSCGGVRATMDGITSVPGLYAIGETACTGVHGANRLASNSLLEGLVTGARAARHILDHAPRDAHSGAATGVGTPVVRSDAAISVGTPAAVAGMPTAGLIDDAARNQLTQAMSRDAAVRRTAEGLADLARLLAKAATDHPTPDRRSWEMTNLHALATALVAAAELRAESRGAHNRLDHPAADDSWRAHIHTTLDATGEPHLEVTP